MERLLTADPRHPAIIMALSGETITHGQLEARANKIAHLLRAVGLKRSDHCAVLMENHPRYIECGFGAERAGLYYTNVNSYLTPGELAYVVSNSLSQVLITSRAHLAVARQALRDCPRVKLCLVVDGPGDGDAVRNLDEATAAFPDTPIPDEFAGMGDVVFIRNDRPAERYLAAACRYACETHDAARSGLRQILGRSERRDLPRAGPALPLGALGGGGADHCAQWNRRRHGALRRGSGSSGDREISRDLTPSSSRRCSRAC